jgi:hypothetical protein
METTTQPVLGDFNQYHYIYKITNNINNKFYIGKHSSSDLEDGYFGSSTYLNNSILTHGKENFTKEIISYHTSSENAYLEESKLVTFKEVDDVNCYNRQPGGTGFNAGQVLVKDGNGGFKFVSKDEFATGNYEANCKGYKHTKEFCEKKKKYANNMSDEHKRKLSEYANNMTVEHRRKISEANARRGQTEETKKKISETYKNAPDRVCPHCGKVGRPGVGMNRYHFNNCKKK